jgi:hypothetical protein
MWGLGCRSSFEPRPWQNPTDGRFARKPTTVVAGHSGGMPVRLLDATNPSRRAPHAPSGPLEAHAGAIGDYGHMPSAEPTTDPLGLAEPPARRRARYWAPVKGGSVRSQSPAGIVTIGPTALYEFFDDPRACRPNREGTASPLAMCCIFDSRLLVADHESFEHHWDVQVERQAGDGEGA